MSDNVVPHISSVNARGFSQNWQEHQEIIKERNKQALLELEQHYNIVDHSLQHYVGKTWMRNFLEKHGIGFRKSANKIELWHLIEKNAKSNIKSDTKFWDTLRMDEPIMLDRITMEPKATCDDVVNSLANKYKSLSVTPSMEEIQRELKNVMRGSESVMIPYLSSQVLDKITKKTSSTRSTVKIHNSSQSLERRYNELFGQPSNSSEHKHVLRSSHKSLHEAQAREIRKNSRKKKKNEEELIPSKEDVGFAEFHARQEEVQKVLDLVYEDALIVFNKPTERTPEEIAVFSLQSPTAEEWAQFYNPEKTNEENDEFVNHIRDEVERILRTSHLNPGLLFLRDLAKDTLEAAFGEATPKEIDIIVKEWEDVIEDERLAEMEKEVKDFELTPEQEEFYIQVAELAKISPTLTGFISQLKEMMINNANIINKNNIDVGIIIGDLDQRGVDEKKAEFALKKMLDSL
jgi:hypothetical protein